MGINSIGPRLTPAVSLVTTPKTSTAVSALSANSPPSSNASSGNGTSIRASWAPPPSANANTHQALEALHRLGSSADLAGLYDPQVILTALGVEQGEGTTASKKASAHAEILNMRNTLAKRIEDDVKAWKAQHSSDVLQKILLVIGILGAAASVGASAGIAVAAALAPILALSTAGAAVGKGMTDYVAKTAGADSQRAGQQLEESRDNLKDLVNQLRENLQEQTRRLDQTRALIDAKRALNHAIVRG
jgi:hypothetical protein